MDKQSYSFTGDVMASKDKTRRPCKNTRNNHTKSLPHLRRSQVAVVYATIV